MKRLFYLLIAVTATIGCTQAKTTDNTGTTASKETSATQDQNTDHIPPYQLTAMDGTLLTPNTLKKDKPVMILYFAPDCGHCRKLLTEMKPILKDLRKVQIVMVTFSRVEAMEPFYKEFGLAAYPNIIMGTEGNHNMIVQRYYQLKETPFIAFYDHSGKLVKSYEKPPEMDELMKTVKKG
jgi:thiol-disulfide isomerase/thioredoxin